MKTLLCTDAYPPGCRALPVILDEIRYDEVSLDLAPAPQTSGASGVVSIADRMQTSFAITDKDLAAETAKAMRGYFY